MNFDFEEYIWPVRDGLQSADPGGSWNSWLFNCVLSLPFVAPFLQNQYLLNSARLLILGTIIETGRRLCYWIMDRYKFQYSVTARFDEGDPTYNWILLFLTERKLWRRSQDFSVNAKNSKRKWGVNAASMPQLQGHAEYVPTYELPQLFRWKGYWVEVKRNKFGAYSSTSYYHDQQNSTTIFISIYTLDMSAISVLVEEARNLYKERSRPDVVIYSAESDTRFTYGPSSVWNNVKNKARRPLSSIILLEGVITSLVQDVEEFMASEEWYLNAGIPYKRGYLLYGPPGTGKTSTIYALAGELGLEIYSLSLSSGFVDDSFLQKAASSIPKHSIFLIEDIDCAFPPRVEDADAGYPGHEIYHMGPTGLQKKSLVTLSGLLNVLDGVGSEEGKLFFATTNYIDRLDTALLRPGRIDKKLKYFLATQAQASALFMRFYGWPLFKGSSLAKIGKEKVPALNSTEPPSADLPGLASQFASKVPTHTFSTAELQGYLLLHKDAPEDAVGGVGGWVESELEERLENTRKEQKKKEGLRQELCCCGVPTAGPGPRPRGVGGGGVGVPQPPPPPMVSEVSPGVVSGHSSPGPGEVYGRGVGSQGETSPPAPPPWMVSEVGLETVSEYSNGEVQGGSSGLLTHPTMPPPPPFLYPGTQMEMCVTGNVEGAQ